jgi:ParB family chromosome partitioning protein
MKEEKIELAGLRFSSNRAYGGEGDIQILAEDIKRNGIINPITVKPFPEEACAGQMAYEVIAGRRRVQAVTLLGWKDIPSRILEGSEIDHAEEIAGSENINRMAMHPLDEAAVFYKLIESGRPIEDLAKQYDRSVSAIWQRIQLLDLSDDIKTLFRNGNLSLYAAAMLKSLDEKDQQDFCKKANDYYVYYIEKKKGTRSPEIRDAAS